MADIQHDQDTAVLPVPTHQSSSTHVPGQSSSFSEHSKPSVATQKQARIMVVDDEPINIKVVQKYLKIAGYENFISTTDSTNALDTVASEDPDIILLDIVMPKVDGLEILERIRADEERKHIPIVILTASNDQPTKQKALELGATDFLAKPVDPSDLIPRVRNALLAKSHHDQTKAYAKTLEQEVRQRTVALAQSRLDVIHRLGRAAEYRDNETGQHVIRVGRYVGVIARGLHLGKAMVELLEHASPLHDVGKIGIPDAILLKPGKLTPEEFETMQKHCQLGRKVFHRLSHDEQLQYLTHTELGAKILDDAGSPLLEMAASIAMSHHEKWDGTGYPLALAGEDIPIEGRITAVADVFDALSSKRPYKPAFPERSALRLWKRGGANSSTRVFSTSSSLTPRK